jgi:hypothetical protein
MEDGMNLANQDALVERVAKLMEKLDKDQELQDLAERNGLDVKNTLRLTPETKDNLAVSVLCLLLAQQANDPKYRTLTQAGLQKRKLKAEIVDEYKGTANQLIKKYRDSKSA